MPEAVLVRVRELTLLEHQREPVEYRQVGPL